MHIDVRVWLTPLIMVVGGMWIIVSIIRGTARLTSAQFAEAWRTFVLPSVPDFGAAAACFGVTYLLGHNRGSFASALGAALLVLIGLIQVRIWVFGWAYLRARAVDGAKARRETHQ